MDTVEGELSERFGGGHVTGVLDGAAPPMPAMAGAGHSIGRAARPMSQ